MTLAVMRYLLGLLFGPSPAPAPTAKQQPAAAAGKQQRCPACCGLRPLWTVFVVGGGGA